jgi:hypothetical protein
VKLFVKGNEQLTLTVAVGLLSILTLSISFFHTFDLMVKAQGQNQTSSAMSQETQQKLTALAEKFKELVTDAGANFTVPQGGNLTEKLSTLNASGPFSNLSQMLPQLSEQGLNVSGLNLREEVGSDLAGLVQKLQNLTSSRGT